jgi:large subunit ribosomal protein L10
MSKVIKQMEMDALKHTFKDVRDLVVLSSDKLTCQIDYGMRAMLRKKKIHVQMVKNTLARRVFSELGMNTQSYWQGTTMVAWGGGSLAELSKDIDDLVKKNAKLLKVKGAISEGLEIDFKAALSMPTRAQAIGRVVSLAMSPASRLIGQLMAPGARISGQLKTLSEKTEATAEAAEAPAAAAV